MILYLNPKRMSGAEIAAWDRCYDAVRDSGREIGQALRAADDHIRQLRRTAKRLTCKTRGGAS